METTKSPHQPVLLEGVLKVLAPSKNDKYLDLTAGYGGHAEAILSHTHNHHEAVLVDRDNTAIEFLRNRFDEHSPQIIHSDMVAALNDLKHNNQTFDLILIDAGVSSLHLDQPERGFSFQKPGPLDMRMDRTQSLKAADIVNGWPEEELKKILLVYGEEKQAGRIAKAVVGARPLETTIELADVVSRAVNIRGARKMHPATRTFQAIRIAVNGELDQLEKAIPMCVDLLREGGRIAVISFHSLEDRIVKRIFIERAGDRLDSELQLLTKSPITAGDSDTNPRARSAKLRAAVKIKTKIRKE